MRASSTLLLDSLTGDCTRFWTTTVVKTDSSSLQTLRGFAFQRGPGGTFLEVRSSPWEMTSGDVREAEKSLLSMISILLS
jgi:hypothetical protein